MLRAKLVVRRGNVNSHCIVRIHGPSSSLSPPQPHLFLSGKDKVEVIFCLADPFHSHEQHQTGHPIIHVGRDSAVPGLCQPGVINCGVPHPDQAFRLISAGGTYVNEQVGQLQLSQFRTLVRAHHTMSPVLKTHRRMEHFQRGNAPDGPNMDKSLVVNMGGH